jgi:hypothetical protein
MQSVCKASTFEGGKVADEMADIGLRKKSVSGFASGLSFLAI